MRAAERITKRRREDNQEPQLKFTGLDPPTFAKKFRLSSWCSFQDICDENVFDIKKLS